jgi:two-component system, OmpR family, alkaline phosphatase synthesis response regulator PhoP
MPSCIDSNHQLVIGLDRHDVRVDGQLVELFATEFQVLQLLASAPGRTFSRVEILDGIHAERYAITPRAVDGQIMGLRRRLGPAADFIETVRGAGYRLKCTHRSGETGGRDGTAGTADVIASLPLSLADRPL